MAAWRGAVRGGRRVPPRNAPATDLPPRYGGRRRPPKLSPRPDLRQDGNLSRSPLHVALRAKIPVPSIWGQRVGPSEAPPRTTRSPVHPMGPALRVRPLRAHLPRAVVVRLLARCPSWVHDWH